MKGYRMHIDVRDNISPSVALLCLSRVIEQGKVGGDGRYYCYATSFDTPEGSVVVEQRLYRKSDCFIIFKYKE